MQDSKFWVVNKAQSLHFMLQMEKVATALLALQALVCH